MSGSNSKITLGVVAISFNEERDLPGFLKNLIPWLDEIIIIDDGSIDNTCEIAQAAGEKVRFIISPRVDGEYFADQRNKGIEVARSDWLIHMDIDERISPDFALDILEAIRNPEFDAYHYRRRNFFLHRPMQGGGWTDWNLIHLARRDILRFSGMYHENVDLKAPENRVGQLNKFMLHLNDESYIERLQKSSVYQFEMSEMIKKEKKALGYFDIMASFVIEFVYKYFWKRGFLDGVPGLIWAFHAATANLRAHSLVWDEQNRIPRRMLEKRFYLEWEQQGLEEVLNKKRGT